MFLVQSDTLRLCVSRDHFSIRRDDDKFFVTNLSGNGTVVGNKRFLERKGEQLELMNNDIIQLVQTSIAGIQAPFLSMRFHVVG